MQLPQVNYLAVLVSGIVIFLLGGLWYSKALFANKWMALMGKSEAEMKAAGGPPMGLMLLQAFLTGLINAWALAVILNHFANPTPLRGALVGGFCWLGFAGATSYATALFSLQPKQLWIINTGFNLVSFLLAGVILACWR